MMGHHEAATLVGWISIACWIVVYSPQIWTCYSLKSGEGLSVMFIAIWLAGDLANTIGAIWQGLLPTMILLAVYYSTCDIILLYQVYYYRWLRRTYPERFSKISPLSETSLLLPPSSATTKPGGPHLLTPLMRQILEFAAATAFVLVVGVLAWWFSGSATDELAEEVWDLKAQIFGWLSAFLYLGSRIPQIAKNKETKCEGLSLTMFCFSVAGNVTYVLSILLQGVGFKHLWINASWLLGSGGTIFLDAIVLLQFFWYREERGRIRLSDDDEDDV
ncbi:PQ-loop-domain-containing protein [Atractiella rhizophila]|nr:PQ-loop-domain-containing protein [Atractiella rhizophila]